jgi:hypothetical protein
MSYQRSPGRRKAYHDYDKPAPEPRLRGGHGLPYDTGSASSLQLDYGRSSQPQRERKAAEGDFFEVTASDFHAAQRSRTTRREISPVAGGHAPTGIAFDFNDNQQPNPWQAEAARCPEVDAELEVWRLLCDYRYTH